MPSLYERRILRQINRRRRAHQMSPVWFDEAANKVATAWAQRLALLDRFEHQDMQRVLDRCNATHVGEIMGLGDASPRRFAVLWMHSPVHRKVMLNPVYRRAGVAAVRGAQGMVVVVDFVRR